MTSADKRFIEAWGREPHLAPIVRVAVRESSLDGNLLLKQGTKIVAVALLSLGVVVGSEALTLGVSRGAVLIGRSLNIVVPVQMEAGDAAASLCLEADVFHGDNRQDSSRVRVLVEAAAQPQTAAVRILSSAIVDEPIVTVVLRTGCGQKTSRRYVLLADPPSEVAAPTVPQIVAAREPAPAKVKESSIAAVPASSAGALVSGASTKAVRAPRSTARPGLDRKRPDVTALVASPQAAKPDEKGAIARPAAQSRLTLDPLEFLSDRVANLDTPMTFEPTEDALRNIQKVQTLEGDVKALLALTAKNEASLMDLRARLQKAEAERFSGGMLYGLIALVLACLAALALLWSRQRRVQAISDDWWSGSIATPAPGTIGTPPEPPPESLAASQHASKVQPFEKRAVHLSKPFNEAGASTDVDVNLTEMSDSSFEQFMPPGAIHPVERKQSSPHLPATTLPPTLARNLNSEAVLDLRQQADFFLSLGQTEQAVQILKRQISESDAPSPFVYLDLLSIFHALGLKNDFEQVREHFNHVFNGSVLEFSRFRDEGRDLEDYPDILSTITALWPSPQVVAFIESWIFRSSLDSAAQALDLAAFRDLLLLHAVAQNIFADPRSDARETKAVDRPHSVSPGFFLKATRNTGALDLDLSQSNADGSGEWGGFAPSLAADIDLSNATSAADDADAAAHSEAAAWPLAPKK